MGRVASELHPSYWFECIKCVNLYTDLIRGKVISRISKNLTLIISEINKIWVIIILKS